MGESSYTVYPVITGRQMKASSQLHDPAALPPGKQPVGGWLGPRPVWTLLRETKSSTPGKNWTPCSPLNP